MVSSVRGDRHRPHKTKKARHALQNQRDDLESIVNERTREVRESEGRLRSLYASMTEGLAIHEIVYDAGKAVDYIITDVNPAFERITGIARAVALGRRGTELYGTDKAPYLEIYARVAAGGTPENFESYFPPMEKHLAISVFSPQQGQFATVFSDITDRKRAEEELVRLASFPERDTNAIIELDYFGKIRYLNPRAKESFPDIVETGFAHPILSGMEQLIRTPPPGEAGLAMTQEVRVGDTCYHQTILNIPESRLIRLYCVDITEAKRVDEAVRDAAIQEQAAKYARNLIEVSLDPLVTISSEGKITDVNEATVKATGVPRQDLIGTDFSSYFTEPDLAERGYRQVFAEGYVTDYPLTIRSRDGRFMDVLYNASLYTDPQGRVQGVFAAARDVTAQKHASQYARSLIEVSIDPLVTISADGKITDVNQATVTATGVPREELVGTDFSGYFTEPVKAERGYRQVFANGFVTDYPLTIRHRDGRQMDVLYNASLYKDSHGKVLGIFAAARDVTLQKKAERELRRHKEHLEALVRERTVELEKLNTELARSNENLQQFAYASSHDLQEPLRVMSSFSQLLEKRYKNRLDADADEFIGYIVESAARMQNLITDLLAYSRAGHKDAQRTSIDCTDVVRRVVQNMSATIASAGGKVTINALPKIVAHEAGIVQLFQNLISNALKFHGVDPPQIDISARKADTDWVFTVRDNGIGIEPEYFQRIFLVFQRLHTREEYAGTGIGLSICKKIVENLGGRMWVESEVGKGTTFFFTIPEEESQVSTDTSNLTKGRQ